MALPNDHWLHNAKIGDLHKKLGVKVGEKIPTKILLKAARNEEKMENTAKLQESASQEKKEDYSGSKNAIKASMGY
jgi:hypothetical protein